jgi:hypothetical protein
MKTQTKVILGIISLAFLASVIFLTQFFLKYASLDFLVGLVTFVTLMAFAASEYRSGAAARRTMVVYAGPLEKKAATCHS